VKKPKAKTILVVEDEPSICQVCNKVFTKAGYQTDIATNAKIAQGILEVREYDLCLIDIRTPTMNGFELYQWLEEHHPAQAERVIFTSGEIYDKDTEESIKISTRQFLPKPFTIEELKAAVEEFFKKMEK